jgi:glycosyltransferase involved in cell wall biosynthesis
MNVPGGGAERVLAAVASGLVVRGHEVAVLTFDPSGGVSYYPLHKRVQRIELGLGATSGPANLLITMRRVRAMRVAIQRYSPDVVIGFMHSMFVPLAFSMARLNTPLIASEHIVYQHYTSRKLQRILLWLVPWRATTILCVSEEAKATYPQFLRRHMEVVPNPVTLTVRDRADVSALSATRKRLLSVGRLEYQKDYMTLIEAFAQLADSQPAWDLKIIGEGSFRAQLEQKIAQFRLDDRISLPGTVQDISGEYRKAQLFVLPSRYESFSLSTAEALSYGLPVVGFSDCSAIGRLVRSGENGVLAEPGDNRAVSLAGALRPLLESAELRREMAARCQPLKEYSLENVLDQWEAFFNACTNRSPSLVARTS